MPISNWTELKSSIENWMQRSDLTDLTADFISLAEVQIANDLRIRAMEQIATGSFSGQTLALPTGFLQAKSFKYSTGSTNISELAYFSPEQYSQYCLHSGAPKGYTILEDHIYLAPVPDSGYAYTLCYYKQFDSLSAGNPTNWLILSSPNVYLCAAMTAACGYTQDDDQAKKWAAAYSDAVGALQLRDTRDRHPGLITARVSRFGVV